MMPFYHYFLIFIALFQLVLSAEDKLKTENALRDSLIPKAINNFGHNLLQTLCKSEKPDGNILISPLNIYTALALTYLGTSGTTRSELQKQIFGIPASENETSIHQALGEITTKIEAKTDKYMTFTETVLANGLFVQNGLQIKGSYNENAEKYYKAKPTNVNFAEQPQQALDTINKWVSEKTKERIPKLFESPLESSTKIVLASALYFNGRWQEPFSPYKTKKEKFITEDKKEIEVDMMNNIQRVPYVKETSLQYEAIRLPYERVQYEMIIVLPTGQQTLKNLTQHLKEEDYKKLFKDEGTEGFDDGVDYKIPRMKFKWSHSIKSPLEEIGVKALFEKADLSNMVETATGDLRVSDVTHATEIEVDEKGTKASALTGVKVIGYMAPQTPRAPKPFVVTKPFLMMIYNRPTSTLLFKAYVNNPVSNA